MKKHEKRQSITQKAHEEKFQQSLDDLFDVAHGNAPNMMTIEEDKQFLMVQREKGRQGCMGGVDANLVKKPKKKQVDLVKHGERKEKADEEAEASNMQIILEGSSSSATEDLTLDDEGVAGSSGVSLLPPKRRRKQILTPALSSCLDRANVSDRAAMFIVSETAKSLGDNFQDFTLSAASIRCCRRSHREQFADEVLKNFSPNAPLTVHWDGKLLPDLTGNKSVDRLPILGSFGEDTQLLSVPKIVAGTGEAQANAVYQALKDWSLQDSVQALCFDTTSANTGRINGACVMIEQLLSRDLLHLACRYHLLELIAAAAFKKVLPSSSSPNIQIFERFKDNWKFIDQAKYEDASTDEVAASGVEDIQEEMIKFIEGVMTIETQPRDDYRELM